MKIGPAKDKGIAGVKPARKKGDKERPNGYVRGRPASYRPEYCDSLIEYFATADSWEINYDAKNSGKVLPHSKLPTMERWCHQIGVTTECFRLWVEKYPELKSAYETAKGLQKAFLLELGAAGIGNHITALMLRTNHGMKDEPEETNEIKPLEIRIVKARRPDDMPEDE